jgi:hypothetical protein
MGRRNLATDRRRQGAAPAAAPVFDPATLPLTMWVRAAYAGAPWSGVASAGASGANPLIAGTAPAVGANLNGLATADFDGATHQLDSTDFAEVCVPTTGYVVAALFLADALQAAAVYPDTYNAAALLTDPYGFNFGVDDAGLAIGHYDGVWKADRLAGVSTSTWTLGQVRYAGGLVKLRLNGGAWSAGIAATDLLTPAATYKSRTGVSAPSVTRFFDGRIAEIIAAASLSDADLDNYRSYLNSRYGLAV